MSFGLNKRKHQHGHKDCLDLSLKDTLANITPSIERAILYLSSAIVKIENVSDVSLKNIQAEQYLSGKIKMESSTYSGWLFIHLHHEVLIKSLKVLIQEDIQKIDKHSFEVVKEYANSIYGILKSSLNDQGHDFAMAFPTSQLFSEALIDYNQDIKTCNQSCALQFISFNKVNYLEIHINEIENY